MPQDHYQTLGISSNTTLEDARQAYIKRVRVLHPDRFDPVKQRVEWEVANQLLQEVNAAWDAIEKSKTVSTANISPSPEKPKPKTKPVSGQRSPKKAPQQKSFPQPHPNSKPNESGNVVGRGDLVALSVAIAFILFCGLYGKAIMSELQKPAVPPPPVTIPETNTGTAADIPK